MNDTGQKGSRLASDVRELRTMVVRSLNTVGKLESAVRELSRAVSLKEQKSDRRPLVTVTVVVILIITSFFFYFRREVTHYKETIAIMTRQEEYLKKDLTEMKKKFFDMENNDIQAYNLYVALKEGTPDAAFKMYGKFNLSSLSRLERLVIDHEVSLIRQKAATKKFEEGVTLFRRKSYQAAITRFKESLDISSTGEHISKLFYLTALAQYRMKDYNKAAITFERFLFVNTKKGFERDKAELLLGVCYERLKQYDRAVNFYKQVLKDNKYSRFKPTIRDRIKILTKKLERANLSEQHSGH